MEDDSSVDSYDEVELNELVEHTRPTKNINSTMIDMLQEHDYEEDEEESNLDMAPEMAVDENTILLPVAGENGLNTDDPAMAFSASDFLQEEEEVVDPMEINFIEKCDTVSDTKRDPTYAPGRKPLQAVKKRRGAEYVLASKPATQPKRRGRKPGSKVINGQVYYPIDEKGTAFSKLTPKGPVRISRNALLSSPHPKSPKNVVEIVHIDENQCRVCKSTEDLVNIFKKEYSNTYAEKLMTLCPSVDIQRKDYLPKFICQACMSTINAAFTLKSQCEDSDAEFRAQLESSINKLRRNYTQVESETEEIELPVPDAEYKISDPSITSLEDSDSDYGKPSPRRKMRRRIKRKETYGSIKIQPMAIPSTTKKFDIEPEEVLKLSDQEQDAAPDFSSGSEENYSPPKKRRSRTERDLDCQNCGEAFPTREDLRKHRKEQHSQFECNLCGKKFRVHSSLRAHIDKHTQSGELKCEHCDKHFPNKPERRRHMVEVHNETPSQFVCEKCKRAFTSEVRLQRHNESRCPGFDSTLTKKRVDLDSLSVGKDLFKCVAPLTTTYWSDSFSD